MPYKDIEKRKQKNKEYQKTYYQNNKSYYMKKSKERQKQLREEFDQWKSTLKCSRCPENHPACLEFHHLDPSSKDINISDALALGWGKERFEKEVEKCIVLCSNCHRKLHYNEKCGELRLSQIVS